MLDGALGLKRGEVANIMRLDDGLRQVNRTYGKHGYIAQSARYTPRLDDASRRAVFEIVVEEGPQFRMGTIEFAGLADRDAAELQKKWRLKTGDVYDATYSDQFLTDAIHPLQRRDGPSAKRATLETRADQEKRAVDVRYSFK